MFAKGWKQRRDAARARANKTRGNPDYREAMAEKRLRDMASEHLAVVEDRHTKLLAAQAEIHRQLVAYEALAADENRLIGPSHPLKLQATAIVPLIADAAAALKPARAEFARKMRESDQRTVEMKARHEANQVRRIQAEAAATAAAESILTETDSIKE